MNKLQFPQMVKNNSNKEDIKNDGENKENKEDKDNKESKENEENKENKENTIKLKPRIGETTSVFKASSVSLYNCKEGVLENWDGDFDINDDEQSHTYDSYASFTITPGIYYFIICYYIYFYFLFLFFLKIWL